MGLKQSLIFNQNSKYVHNLRKIPKINSFHNYSINNLGKNLLVSAKNNKGTIKAIEHEKYRIFGQMWHSEREHKFYSEDITLIQDFFK